MATLNVAASQSPKPRTHEGGIAKRISPERELQRSVLSCLLWESEFYEDGVGIAERIAELVPKVQRDVVAGLAVAARSEFNLRHVPSWLARCACQHKTHMPAVEMMLANIIQRPDELCEFLAMYWKDGRCPLAACVKRGLAAAFTKFNAYQLAKYRRVDKAIKLRDVMFLVHPKPASKAQAEVFKQLADNTLPTPDTWETALSGGGDKRDHWSRLLREQKLGGLALLRNLRNMLQVYVPTTDIAAALAEMKVDRVLPFRFIAAARYAPQLESQIEQAMMRSLLQSEVQLPGTTIVLVDVSGSMAASLSRKSDMTRLDAACGLAIILRELCENVRVFSFSEHLIEVPGRHGFALRDVIDTSQRHWSTYLGRAVTELASQPHDRMVVVTDEQSHDTVPGPAVERAYMLNVASNKNGIGYGKWTHVDGFSEAVVRFIAETEGYHAIRNRR